MRLLSFWVSTSLVLCLGAMPLQAWPAEAPFNPVVLYQATREPALLDALLALHQTGQADTLNTLLNRGTHVLFRDMASFGPMYQANDAITWVGDDGSQTIYISHRHMGAPPQAIACLIAHELIHADPDNSTAEELVGWQRESALWQTMLVVKPQLKQIAIKTFPLVDRLNAIVLLDKQGKLTSTVETNPVYQGLPKHSPGF